MSLHCVVSMSMKPLRSNSVQNLGHTRCDVLSSLVMHGRRTTLGVTPLRTDAAAPVSQRVIRHGYGLGVSNDRKTEEKMRIGLMVSRSCLRDTVVFSTKADNEYDAILVLGGGLLPDGGIPPWVIRRLDGALELHNSSMNAGNNTTRVPILLLGAGTPHKLPVINPQGYVLHEATAYAEYLIEKGVHPRDLYKETQSYDTVGNAYFSLTIHAIPASWYRLAIVTSAFHMPRTEAIFRTTYQLAEKTFNSTNMETASRSTMKFDLSFHPASDEGIFSAEVLEARAIKEQAAIQRWNVDTSSFRTLTDMHRWFYATHLCYSVSRQNEFGVKDDLDPRLAATY